MFYNDMRDQPFVQAGPEKPLEEFYRKGWPPLSGLSGEPFLRQGLIKVRYQILRSFKTDGYAD
jgi:hypothetical protein